MSADIHVLGIIWDNIDVANYTEEPLVKDTSLQETNLLSHFNTSNDPSTKDTSIKRTSLLVPMVSVIEGFHCV